MLGALLPASSGAAPTSKFIHDVKVFHQVAGQRSQPQPAEIALIIGGKPIGKLVPGLNQKGKQLVIADVRGGRTVLVRRTGKGARVSVEVASACRAHPNEDYYLRAEAAIRGKLRKVFSRGDCGWVNQVVGRKAQGVTHTTFIFEN